jgi:hypothetical protein
MCIGVGGIDVNGKGFAEEFAAGVWHRMGLPSGTPGLFSISCVSSTWCMAIGGTNSTIVALDWNGSTWKEVTPTANSRSGPNPSIDAVSCFSISFCMAVGYSEVSTPLAEAWSGTSWTVTTPPPVGVFMTYQALGAVSCTSASSCLAVGESSGAAGILSGIVLTWDGSSWTDVSDPSQIWLNDISCTSAKSCLVVGTNIPNDYQSFRRRDVVERWQGTTLTAIKVAAVGKQIALNAVSCSRANWCAVVGSFTMRAGVTRPLVERWNGRKLNRMWAPT